MLPAFEQSWTLGLNYSHSSVKFLPVGILLPLVGLDQICLHGLELVEGLIHLGRHLLHLPHMPLGHSALMVAQNRNLGASYRASAQGSGCISQARPPWAHDKDQA